MPCPAARSPAPPCFALGIQPYINASIIIQLLTVAIPALERLAKDGGEDGKKKIAAHHPLHHGRRLAC